MLDQNLHYFIHIAKSGKVDEISILQDFESTHSDYE